MAGVFEDYQSKRAPPWLRRAGGQALLTTVGEEKDGQLQRLTEAVLSNVPGVGPDDALNYIGKERNLPFAAADVDAAHYAERLRTCWDAVDGWSYAGSHGSLLRALARAGLPSGLSGGAIIMQRIRRYSYLAGAYPGTVTFADHPDPWTFDWREPTVWNQFGILFDGDVSGLEEGSDLAAILNTTVRLWKPAKARFMGTWVIVSGPTWGWPIGVEWGDVGRDWGGGETRFVPPR